MRYRNVVALEIVIDIHFPIRVDQVLASFDLAQAVEIQMLCLIWNIPQHLLKRWRRPVQVDECEGSPGFSADWNETEIVLVKVFHSVEFRRFQEFAVKTVEPAVILALQGFAIPTSMCDHARAVTTYIVKCADFIIQTADEDDRYAVNIHCSVVTRELQ